ncbi:MAG: hypothetical protein FJX02_16970 [Alphaproteobacteria bacterium]|nr:hypothetical protein [Alphaproteobacteria bacterium]
MRYILPAIAAGLALSVLGGGGPARAHDATTVTCSLSRQVDRFAGTCLVPCMVNQLWIDIDGPRRDRSCAAPSRPVQVSIAPQPRFDDWLGTMEGKEPEDPTRFSLITPREGREGVAKTPFGWFALREARVTGDTMALVIDARRQLPPTEEDLAIIARARALMASEAVWNREDDRRCPANPVRWSLFCAMMQATTETSGGVHYRQPAMQAVREVLNEVGGNRVKLHRIMDYNNHPDTTLDDTHALLDRARVKLEARPR